MGIQTPPWHCILMRWARYSCGDGSVLRWRKCPEWRPASTLRAAWENPRHQLQSCCCCFSRVRLCDPMDCSLPGSSVHGIFQARVLEWGAISFSKLQSRKPQRQWLSPHSAQTSTHLQKCLRLSLSWPLCRAPFLGQWLAVCGPQKHLLQSTGSLRQQTKVASQPRLAYLLQGLSCCLVILHSRAWSWNTNFLYSILFLHGLGFIYLTLVHLFY